MKFVFDTSLTEEAKAALAKGPGDHGKFLVGKVGERNTIAVVDENGKVGHWHLVVHNENPVIEEVKA